MIFYKIYIREFIDELMVLFFFSVSTISDGVQKKSHKTKKPAIHKGEITNSVILGTYVKWV